MATLGTQHTGRRHNTKQQHRKLKDEQHGTQQNPW